jgi:probable H4MPT-linked C1 transfer pathway protein
MILGLDIGGANTKAASSDGSVAKSVYLPLWRNAKLDQVMHGFAEIKPEAVGVVITGELADCYQSKLDGLVAITSAVEDAFSCPIYFWGVNGFDWKDIADLAAANWSASSALVSKDSGDCLFVDMGSTTTDLIPIISGPLCAKTDFERLANGELVYMGLLRTSLGSLLQSVTLNGKNIPVCPEFFSIIADAHIVTGQISSDQYSCDTPDGYGKDQSFAKRRLARIVCADLGEIGDEGAISIAKQAVDVQQKILAFAIARQCSRHSLNYIVAAGIGEKIIALCAENLGIRCTCLSEMYGKRLSDIFPAYAVARLLENWLLDGKPVSQIGCHHAD